MLITTETSVLILLNDEVKKHVWFMILCALFCDILEYCLLAIFFVLYIEFLKTCSELLYYIYYLHVLWLNILEIHLGHGVSMVSVSQLILLI